MANWEFKEKRQGEIIRIRLVRDGSLVGFVDGVIRAPAAGPKYFGDSGISVKSEYQQEYMKAHNGMKMGEALGFELMKTLKREGVSYIRRGGLSVRGVRAVERGISSGIIEKTHIEGTGGELLKINWEKLPATEEAKTGMIKRIRRREAPKRIVKKVWGILRRPFHRRPK